MFTLFFFLGGGGEGFECDHAVNNDDEHLCH